MEVRGLFSSWATPATSCPMAASFSERASCRCSAALSMVTARSPASSSIFDISSSVTRETSRGSLRAMHPTCAPRVDCNDTSTWQPFFQYCEGSYVVGLGTWPYLAICSGSSNTEYCPSLVPMLQASTRVSNFHTLLHLCSTSFAASPSYPEYPAAYRFLPSGLSMIVTRSKVLVSRMASAISLHIEFTSTPFSRREVIPANFCSCWLTLRSRLRADLRNSDLSSSSVRIIPKATKNLGVFHSSGFTFNCGAHLSSMAPIGNTDPHSKKPPALVITPGVQRW